MRKAGPVLASELLHFSLQSGQEYARLTGTGERLSEEMEESILEAASFRVGLLKALLRWEAAPSSVLAQIVEADPCLTIKLEAADALGKAEHKASAPQLAGLLATVLDLPYAEAADGEEGVVARRDFFWVCRAGAQGPAVSRERRQRMAEHITEALARMGTKRALSAASKLALKEKDIRCRQAMLGILKEAGADPELLAGGEMGGEAGGGLPDIIATSLERLEKAEAKFDEGKRRALAKGRAPRRLRSLCERVYMPEKPGDPPRLEDDEAIIEWLLREGYAEDVFQAVFADGEARDFLAAADLMETLPRALRDESMRTLGGAWRSAVQGRADKARATIQAVFEALAPRERWREKVPE
jgi:hypothetical protein